MKLFSRFFLTLLTMLFLGVSLSATGQTVDKGISVTVKVTDKAGAMPGAGILVKGTTNG